MSFNVSIIVARAENDMIGCSEGLPWNIPEELKYFRDNTIYKPVIMGRKTYESLGRPLKDRQNIVLTKNGFVDGRVIIQHDLESAIRSAIETYKKGDHNEIMVIGGSEIFTQALPYASRVYLTEIEGHFEKGNAFFSFNKSEWKEQSSSEKSLYETSTQKNYLCRFLVMEKTPEKKIHVVKSLEHA